MMDQSSKLIELTSRPLEGNAEQHLVGVALLQERLEEHAASGEAVAEAIETLENADRHPRRRYWRTGLYVITLGAVFAAMVFSAAQVYQAIGFINGNCGGGSSKLALDRHTAGLSPGQKLLMFGKDGAANEAGRWKPLWDNAPDNPTFLAQYAAAYSRENEKLSPEILEAAERIDPNNGWYPALSAGYLMKDSIKAKSQTTKERKENKIKIWEIKNEAKLKEALALIHQAAEKPEFSSYELALLKQRIPLLPPRTDWVSQFPRIHYVASQTSSSIQLGNLAKTLGAGAQECATNHDIEGFRRIVGDWQKLGVAMTRNGGTFLDLLVARMCVSIPLKNFCETSHALGLEKEAARFAKLDEACVAEKEARRLSGHYPAFYNLITTRASISASMLLPILTSQVNNPMCLTDDDLRPGRYAEHAFFSRPAIVITWVFSGVFIGLAALCRLRQNMPVRMLSSRMTDLLRMSDWLWIVMIGVLFPMFWYLSIIHLTSLSSREWSFKATGMVLPVGQFGAMVMLMIILPLVLAGWRLGKRGGIFGLRARFQWMGWWAAGLTAAAIPALGSGMWMPQTATYNFLLGITIVFIGIPLVWLMVVFLRNVFGRAEESLRRATLARLMMPSWMFGILALASWPPFLYALECRWMQQDRLMEISTDAPALTRYEYDVTQVLRAEILKAIAREP